MHLQSHREEALPQIARASVSLRSVYDLIRKKKQELTKRVIDDEDSRLNFPKIQERETTQEELASDDEKEKQRERSQENKGLSRWTPAKKIRTILQLGPLSEEKVAGNSQISNLEIQSKKKQVKPLQGKQKDGFSVSKRLKTEGHNISRKVINNTQLQSHRIRKDPEAEFERIEEAKKRFMTAVTAIPKTMKMRNEANLLTAVEALEVFNPFANRNHRIVNICLLKMGRTLILNSSLLYKIGQELDCFYIILMGKVKLINGELKKICHTGETVLEEVIFTNKQKKIALEKAKTIGKTVLLELTTQTFRKLKQELFKFGYKLGFQEMESIIKRNYIVKNWLRNKVRLEINNS